MIYLKDLFVCKKIKDNFGEGNVCVSGLVHTRIGDVGRPNSSRKWAPILILFSFPVKALGALSLSMSKGKEGL